MTNYKPTTYLVRESALKNGEPSSSITLDTSLSPDVQRMLADQARALAIAIFEKSAFAGRKREPDDHLFEILLGATANRLERMEDLLNDCRNLLIDLEARYKMPEEQRRIDNMMDELDEELGL